MGLFKHTPTPAEQVQERIATALEHLVLLYELELASRGISTRTGQELGEVLETDPEGLALQERYDELRELYGLPPGVFPGAVKPDGTGWKPGDAPSGEGADSLPADDPNFLLAGWNAPWDLPLGPEGAEAVSSSTEAKWSGAGGPPSIFEGRRSEEKQEGKGGADSGAPTERSPEVDGDEPS